MQLLGMCHYLLLFKFPSFPEGICQPHQHIIYVIYNKLWHKKQDSKKCGKKRDSERMNPPKIPQKEIRMEK